MFFRPEILPFRPMQPQRRGTLLLLPSCQWYDNERYISYKIQLLYQRWGHAHHGRRIAELEIDGKWKMFNALHKPHQYRIFFTLHLIAGVQADRLKCWVRPGLLDRGLRTEPVAEGIGLACELAEKFRLKPQNYRRIGALL